MSYSYEAEKANLFTDEGQRMFIKMRDTTFRLLRDAGAVKMSSMMSGVTGDSWTMLACADRMVELGDIVEITPKTVAGQDRVFVRAL
jgi:hypothetical protein